MFNNGMITLIYPSYHLEKPGIEMEEITTVRATKRMVSALKNLKIMISRKLKTGMKTLQTTIPF